MYGKIFKRLIDIVLSAAGLVLLSWLFLIVALLIKLTSKGAAIFVQKRIGKDKKTFNIYKFRTMYIECPADMPTHMLEKAESFITPVGRVLRKFSLDELPQMVNIFKGDMTIIGPRPALWNQDDLIAERDKYNANSVKPGLTGYAQINGRDELPIEVKAKLDGEYVEKMSFWLDVKIFFGTILSVIKHEGFVEGEAIEDTYDVRIEAEDVKV